MRSMMVSAILATSVLTAQLAHADFELTAPDGRRVRLKENGTWAYAQTKDEASTRTPRRELLLSLQGKETRQNNCRLSVQLLNHGRDEVASLVLHYSAYRDGDVIYTVAAGQRFNSLKPGDKQTTLVDFAGVSCEQIARVQVGGGDRCELGELNKFTDAKGECLARVQVMESRWMRFDK